MKNRTLVLTIAVIAIVTFAVFYEDSPQLSDEHRVKTLAEDTHSNLVWVDIECRELERHLEKLGLVSYRRDTETHQIIWRVQLARRFQLAYRSLDDE